MAITEDASSPALVFNGTAGPVTSASFTPPDNSLVVVMVVAGWGGSTTATITDSGSHTWTTKAVFTAGGGIAKIAECYFSTSPGAITVTATYVSNNGGCLLAIKVLNGAHAVQTSAATVAAQYSGNNAVAAITTTVTGSVVYGCANDSSNNDAFTPNGATTTIKDYAEVAGGTELAAYKSTSATGTPGSTNLGGTFGVTGAGNLVMAEVLPAASVAVTKPPIVVSQYAALF